MFSTRLGLEKIPWDFAFHCNNRKDRLLPGVPFFWSVFIFSNLQWVNIATTFYLIQPSVSRFSSCTLITTKPLLDGLGHMKKLRAMALKIPSDVETQQSMASEGLSDIRTRRKQLGDFLVETIRRRRQQWMFSKWQISALRGGGSLSPSIFPKGKPLTRTWAAIYFEAFISS